MSHHDHEHKHDHKHEHDHNHHGHDHKHDHHGHDHKHDHEEKHEQTPSDGELSLDQKLAILIEHWIEHNKSHQGTFESWATKASDEKLIKTAVLLKEISQDSILITKKLEKALQSIKS